MKTFILTVLVAGFAVTVHGQKLIGAYKKGVVKLIPDTEYAVGNDWNQVFKTYYDTLYGKPMGNRKSLVLLPDGSIVVNHAYRNFYSKFSPDGQFQQEFGLKNSKGQQYKKTQSIAGIIKSNIFYTGLDNMGNMICSDFNGDYIKTLKLDYMAKQMISLPNNKIAVVGWVIWSDRFRDFVSIVDYETNEEKIIWEHYTDRCEAPGGCKLFNYGYTFKERGSVGFNTMPFTSEIGIAAPPKLACVGSSLIVSIPTTGEIRVYDVEGNLKSKDQIGWARNYVSVDEQREIQKKAIANYKGMGDLIYASWVSPEENKQAIETIIRQMEADLGKIKDPIPVPVFSTVIKDSDGNLLYFEFPKEEKANKFNVWIYENGGKFVCQSSFVCDEYELEINPSKMIFHKGYIYGLQRLRQATGVPLRLVRFKIEGN